MGKPEDIPQDVLDSAEIALTFLPSPKFSAQVTSVARAIMASKAEEREACAKEAEALRVAWSSSEYSGAFNDGCNTVAAAIRKRGAA